MTKLYEAHPCIDGYEVIDIRTGRPVSEPKATRREANGLAQYWNREASMRTMKDPAKMLRPEDAVQPRSAKFQTRRTTPRRTVPSRRLAA
jgi:hypothetical protein